MARVTFDYSEEFTLASGTVSVKVDYKELSAGMIRRMVQRGLSSQIQDSYAGIVGAEERQEKADAMLKRIYEDTIGSGRGAAYSPLQKEMVRLYCTAKLGGKMPEGGMSTVYRMITEMPSDKRDNLVTRARANLAAIADLDI